MTNVEVTIRVMNHDHVTPTVTPEHHPRHPTVTPSVTPVTCNVTLASPYW